MLQLPLTDTTLVDYNSYSAKLKCGNYLIVVEGFHTMSFLF